MEQRLPHILKTVALAVWSAVLLYFCLTGRLNIFLTPVFRPLVWFAGITLAVVALCYAIFARPGRRSAELECEHHHEHNAALPFSSFLVLVLPVCLAVFISPEGYSRMVVSNRGLVNVGPGMDSQLAAWTGTTSSDDLALMADSPDQASKLAAKEPAPEVYAPDANFIQPLDEADEVAAAKAETEELMRMSTTEPPLPQKDGTVAATQPTTPATNADPVAQMRGYLNSIEKDEQGYTVLEANDLVYAASQPGFREAMKGMKVAVLGQYYPGDEKGAQKLAGAKGPGEADPSMDGGRYFWLVRMNMVCCAADARPTSVKVDPPAQDTTARKDMDWLNSRGTVEFRETGPRNGDPNARWEAWIKADSVSAAGTPDEPFLF